MYSAGGTAWGIVLFGLWLVWSASSFVFAKEKNTRPLPEWSWSLFLGFALVLLLLNSKVMYGELAVTNPQLLARGPIQILPKNSDFYLLGLIWLCLVLLLACVFFRLSISNRTRLAAVLLGVSAATHLIVLRMVPFPLIDVFTAVSEASVALLEGRNPYQIPYTDIYQGQGITPSGFGYLPGLFPWSIAGILLTGDVRGGVFLSLVGMALILVLGFGNKGGEGRFFLACLLFLGAAGLFVAEQAWIDPILGFLIFFSIWLLIKQRLGWAAFLSGLLCATKQYGVIAFCFLWVMAWNREGFRPAIRFFIISIFTGVLIQAPFALWNFSAYWNTAFMGIGNLPFRPDAYTFVSLLSAAGFPVTGIPFLGVLVFFSLLWKCRASRINDPSAILAAIAISYLAIFLTNRHAFCNYYQLVFLLLIGSLYLKEFGLEVCYTKEHR